MGFMCRLAGANNAVRCMCIHKFILKNAFGQPRRQITVRSIVLANLEQFSSHTKEFQVLGSVDHPTKTWMLLGEFKVLMNDAYSLSV